MSWNPIRAAALSFAAACGLGGGQAALAATSDVSPTGFLVTAQHDVKATPHRVYEALGEIDKWWNGSHSWSGKAANLSLSRQAGGCFCERWGQNSVEHARVVHAFEERLLRLDGALGPLQALSVNGVLTFALQPTEGGTALVVTYRVSGAESAGLQQLAAPVDRVIGEQARRLVSYIETGKPE